MWVIVAVFLVDGQIGVTHGLTPFETLQACEEKRDNLEKTKPDNLVGNSACVEVFQGKRFNA